MAFNRLASCLLNISEGRNMKLVEAVANAACKNTPLGLASYQWPIQSTVLNVFSDLDYNRSVITIAAPVQFLKQSVIQACKEAFDKIDISQQSGGHPRLGAVDLIPIYPLSAGVTLEECGNIAKEIATSLASEVPGTSFFYFGAADEGGKRGLAVRRRQVGWFGGKSGVKYEELKFDVGVQPSSRYGLTGIGASYYVMNCNVTINTSNLSIGQNIASALREKNPGGLPGVQVMAFPHEGNVEVACNVESFAVGESLVEKEMFDVNTSGTPKDTVLLHSRKDSSIQTVGRIWKYCSSQEIEQRVRELGEPYGVSVIGTTIVGFTPEEAHRLAMHCLQNGDSDHWKQRLKLYQM